MWMDWNDPDELRRLRDLLARGPGARSSRSTGPDGTRHRHGRDARRAARHARARRLATSRSRNENNDLIWGFLAECHRRGWLYKGHDTMPWCARCGTGISQHEMTEGYADREDPGLTVQLPAARPARARRCSSGPRRRGRSPPTWRRPSGPDLALRQGPPGRRASSGSAAARCKQALEGPFEVLEERPGRDLVGLALPRSVRRPAGRPGRLRRGAGPTAAAYEHRVVPWDEVGEDEGTGIVHIAPGLRRRGLRARQGSSACR